MNAVRALPILAYCCRHLGKSFSLLLLTISVLSTPQVTAQTVRINELMSSNGTTIKDENGDSPDWIELYNPADTEVSLAGYGLSDARTQPFKWRFKSAVIPPKGFLLVFASDKDRQPGATSPLLPTAVPGLKGWLQADRINPADNTEVRSANGQLFVKLWKDATDNSFDARQADTALQPLFIRSSIGGNETALIRFDGSNDLLMLPQIVGTNSFCIIAVIKPTVQHEIDPQNAGGVGGVSGQRYLFGAQHGGDLNGGAGLSVGQNGISVYEHGSSYMPALAVYNGELGPGLVVATLNYQNKTPKLAIQGNSAVTGDTSPRQNVTAPVELGTGSYGSFAGDVAELIFFNRSLDRTEQRGIEEYLAQKYKFLFPTPLHTSFSISADGEKLYLTAPDGTRMDETASVVIPRDVSYGRQPDGAGDFYFFRQPTPGTANTTTGSTEFLAEPTMSIAGGFYTTNLQLTLSHPAAGVEIRYTLDGSEPHQTSTLYTAPLTIRNRSNTGNTISTIPTGGGWQPPASLVTKGTVVRARAFKSGALPSDTATQTYFIFPATKYSMPVLSLSTDPAGFFSPDTGIYVHGNAPGGNYFQRGDDWERPAHVEFWEDTGELAFTQDVGVKIHGNTSRQFPQKGLTIRARYGNSRSPIKYQVFPDRPQKEFEKILLRQSGHDYYLTFIRDGMMQRLVEELGVETQAWRPAIVFLNGEFWGIHDLREIEDKYFFAAHKGVDPENIDFLEGYAVANEGDTVHYDNMLNFIATHDMRSSENFAEVERMMEVDSYIDYKVAEIFYYRWDIGNHRLWRPRTPEGRWRWIQFDNDVGWGGFWSVPPAWSFNMLAYDIEPIGPWTQYQSNPGGNDHNNPTVTFLLRKLLENPGFKQRFINRFADLLNTTFHPPRVISIINQMAAIIEPEMPEHINRWRAPASVSTWRSNVQYLRDYANNRPGFARQHLAQKFGLRGTALVTLGVSSTNSGSIKLNTITVNSTTNAPWTGTYFKDNPITLTAQPAPGFRFVGWEGVLGIETNSMSLFLNGDLKVSAIFEPNKPLAFTSVRISSAGQLQILATGLPDYEYLLQSSDDLLTWSHGAVVRTDAEGNLTVRESTTSLYRFYRIRNP